MISVDDVEDMSCLTRDEIAALAEHEHLSEFDATMLAEYLMHIHKGPQAVQEMICDDIRKAMHEDNVDHAKELFATLRKFISDHPEAARGANA